MDKCPCGRWHISKNLYATVPNPTSCLNFFLYFNIFILISTLHCNISSIISLNQLTDIACILQKLLWLTATWSEGEKKNLSFSCKYTNLYIHFLICVLSCYLHIQNLSYTEKLFSSFLLVWIALSMTGCLFLIALRVVYSFIPKVGSNTQCKYTII